MSEEKILIPAYKRSGNCARCGAAIYAPDLKQQSGWPLMSSCACKHGPKVARKESAENLRREAIVEGQAQAA